MTSAMPSGEYAVSYAMPQNVVSRPVTVPAQSTQASQMQIPMQASQMQIPMQASPIQMPMQTSAALPMAMPGNYGPNMPMLDEKQIMSQKSQALGQLDKQRKGAFDSLNRQYEHQKQLIHFEADRDLQSQVQQLEMKRQQTIMSIEQENMQCRMQIDQANMQQRMQIEQTSAALGAQAQQQRLAREHQEKFMKYQQNVGPVPMGAPMGTSPVLSNTPMTGYPSTVSNLAAYPSAVGGYPSTVTNLSYVNGLTASGTTGPMVMAAGSSYPATMSMMPAQ